MATGCLYIVATPIGNLGDMTFRAVEVLKSVALIAAEDTRHSKFLLTHYGIVTPTISLHDYNESRRIEMLLLRLQQGASIALISDAGTPLISDPGYHLVDAMIEAGIKVLPIPGACAAIAALSASGLPTDHFIFAGFLPAKGEARRKGVGAFRTETRTVILYESPHRILDLMQLLEEILGEQRIIVVARELTKKFETIRRGKVREVHTWIKENAQQQKGEFVILIHGAELASHEDNKSEYERVLKILLEDLPQKQAVDYATKITGAKKNFLYQLALDIKKQ